jgi:bifunctional UDP-N-acetylglucosamine pyrophosphorylase/glucosamine-1-phosphate N-acetyltransferase
MTRKTKAVILAAGKGTRMKSELPKVLHKIQGFTLLERVINETLNVKNVEGAVVITGHKNELVDTLIAEKYCSETISTVLQSPQLGTGHAVSMAIPKLQDFDGNILILCGDTPLLTTEVLDELCEFHNSNNSDLTVLSAIFDDPTNYGRIIKKDGKLDSIVEEKDATAEQKQIKEVNTGVYCLNWQKILPAFGTLKSNNSQNEYYLTDIVKWAVSNNLNTNSFILKDNNQSFGINSKEHLMQATQFLNQRTLKALLDEGVSIYSPETVFISPETKIGADTVIYPGVCIEGKNHIGKNNIIGPNTFIEGGVVTGENTKIIQSKVSNAKIGDNTTVGPFAHIRDNAEISSKVRVGNFVEIKKSQIASNTNVAHLSYVGDAELGENVNIGAGTITANYNALTKQKSKTIIKSGVKTGSNSVLVAPLEIGENANIAAGSVITKDVPENSLAISRAKQENFIGWVAKQLAKIKGDQN